MWDISTGMCLMTLVSPLVFFLAVIDTYLKPVIMKLYYLECHVFKRSQSSWKYSFNGFYGSDLVVAKKY